MTQTVYNPRWFDTALDGTDDDTLGIIGALIGAAPGIFSSIAGLFGGGRKAQCQGLAEIQACGQQAVAAMNQLLQGVTSGQIAPDQAISEASRIVSQFNDPSVVYPAKKGKDAEARNQFISQLQTLQQQIQQAAASVAAATKTNVQQTTSVTGTSGSLLLIGGGVLAAILLLRRD